jgi:hypothetical protein
MEKGKVHLTIAPVRLIVAKLLEHAFQASAYAFLKIALVESSHRFFSVTRTADDM